MGVMIEHFAGSFPVWLSPVQVKVLPISEKYAEYAQTVVDALEKYNISVELDCTSESLGKRIRIAKTEKVPYILVLGEKEVDASTVTVERRDGKQATESILDFVNTVKGEIEAKEIW
jgi:threonyl-tRNA synthetase